MKGALIRYRFPSPDELTYGRSFSQNTGYKDNNALFKLNHLSGSMPVKKPTVIFNSVGFFLSSGHISKKHHK